ncbi:MAG: BON domain-containing protein [Nitrososphaerota archaeon]
MTTDTLVTRSDMQIQQDVLDELDWDTHIRPNEIGVSVKDGIVTLTGQVDSYAKRWAAQEAALRVLGVKAVANDLEVYLHSSTERTDTELARAVVDALTWDAEIPMQGIRVSVLNGWVTLTGQVRIYFQREAAERAVRHLAGVRGVSNALTVRETGPVPADVKQRIERALVRNAETDAARIVVEVQGHRAILKGRVRSYPEKRAAEASARSAPGIAEVENHLVVGA